MNPDLLPEWVAELVKAPVDVIATVGDLAIRTAQEATKTIPILAVTDDMLGAGLVNSLARPNGNTTGLSILATELDGKRQELLIEAVPALRRMAVLADSNRTAAVKLDALRQAANAHNVQLSIHPVAGDKEIVSALDMAQALGATALNVLASQCSMPIASLLWTVPPHCAWRLCTNGPKRRRKAALPPTDRA